MTREKHHLLVGAHMPISDGLENAIIKGHSIGCATIQIFTKSNRQWKARTFDQQEIAAFKAAAQQYSMHPIIAHATYLINIASADAHTQKLSIEALAMELVRCESLAIPYLVLHPGAYVKGDALDGMKRLIDNLDSAFQDASSTTHIALEVMAGQGTTLGHTFEQLATIINNSNYSKQLSVCFDTCHAFVAGYDFTSEKSYQKMWKDFDEIIGPDRLKVIHLNDSKKELGSKVDRHEHIGKGKVGLAAFELLMNDPRFFDVPKILETPKATKEPFSEDKMNLATLRGLLWDETKKKLGIIEY